MSDSQSAMKAALRKIQEAIFRVEVIRGRIEMKFKFCGDGDCPLWALAALHALSTVPATVFRRLVTQLADQQNDDEIMDILKDTNLGSRDECARAAAAVRWVLQQAWRNSCAGSQLSRDLLVLGVPRSHAAVLSELADDRREAHVEAVKDGGFAVNKITDVSASPGPEGSIDSIKLSLQVDNAFTGLQTTQEVLIDEGQAQELLKELKIAYQKMEAVSLEK